MLVPSRPRRNNNSSRFGKFLTLQFSASGRMQGAYMKTYLLEKSRITSQLPGEQNYHVLYQARAPPPSRRHTHTQLSQRGARSRGSGRHASAPRLGRWPRACPTT